MAIGKYKRILISGVVVLVLILLLNFKLKMKELHNSKAVLREEKVEVLKPKALKYSDIIHDIESRDGIKILSFHNDLEGNNKIELELIFQQSLSQLYEFLRKVENSENFGGASEIIVTSNEKNRQSTILLYYRE